ncbi:MAG: hypothetical protein ACR2QG_09845, partial [Gammaproteobacteria bacterium]
IAAAAPTPVAEPVTMATLRSSDMSFSCNRERQTVLTQPLEIFVFARPALRWGGNGSRPPAVGKLGRTTGNDRRACYLVRRGCKGRQNK